MEQFTVQKIGVIRSDEQGMRIALDRKYRAAMAGLEGFSHLNLLWWFSGSEGETTLVENAPYKNAPPVLGVFATRSPARPNPLALSCVEMTWLDQEQGLIGIAWTDAWDGSPVLDIKPYTPSMDRVEHPKTPAWCACWPGSYEASGDFDWESVFLF